MAAVAVFTTSADIKHPGMAAGNSLVSTGYVFFTSVGRHLALLLAVSEREKVHYFLLLVITCRNGRLCRKRLKNYHLTEGEIVLGGEVLAGDWFLSSVYFQIETMGVNCVPHEISALK
ncbi:hypothetical protein CEXT_515041 [Caerostris extrusa]|uniref:Uncharacterized protein n=1 Tax=Caerostris extrusa TaxID=172846 RepID=A0AAV4SS11_CAEEX|nr:hypothetical protein CEXT_515041 [Caerostris extrusa]